MTATVTGKCALVTGSVQGLGWAVAERLAAAGCHVVLNGLAPPETVAARRHELERAHGVRTLYGDADLRQPAEIARMIEAATEAFGSVDILVNNAVVRHAGLVEDTSAAAWDESLAVNLSAAFHAIRLAMPGMKRQRWGRIINVSSIYGLRGAAGRVGYVTTKTALIGLTRAVALEAATYGITCNAVCPGTAETPVHDDTIRALMRSANIDRVEAERRFMVGKQPTGRLVSSGAVAALIVFLCRPDAADITGAALPMDGGWSAS